MKLGDTFLLGNKNGIYHLHVILSDPEQDENIIIIPVTTRTKDDDNKAVVILNSNCGHPFIKHESFLYLERAFIKTVHVIKRYLEDHPSMRKPPFTEQTINDILHKINKAPNLDPRYSAMMDKQQLFSEKF